MALTYAQELDSRRQLIERIRVHTRDWAELNRLIEGEEHSDRMILMAIQDILDDYNNSPPPIGVRFVTDFPNWRLLIDGILAVLLESAALLYARNDVAYAHAGTQVQFNQSQTYMQMSQMYWQRYEAKKKEQKVSENMQQAVAATGGFFSDFVLTFRPTWRIYNLMDYNSPVA